MNHRESTNQLVVKIAEILNQRQQTVTTVESCTGGGIAQALTTISGSSNWFDRGFVTYSNAAKTDLVDVPDALLEKHGAVSLEVASAMAHGGKIRAKANYGLSVTGIAGPGGGSKDKPVGTVCFGWAGPGNDVVTERVTFSGDREQVREKSIIHALTGLLKMLGHD